MALVTDPSLVNPWGISVGPEGPFWISNNGTGMSDLLTGGGQVQTVPVTVPGPRGAVGTPTGTVFNNGPGFVVAQNGVSGPSQFLFANEDGTISGWNPHVNPTAAIVAVDNSGRAADYTGLATAVDSHGAALLYAANVSGGTVDVFNQDFQSVQTAGGFQDPNRPTGYVPFGIQTLDGRVYVTYIPQGAPAAGAGLGFVDVFSADGALQQHISGDGQLVFPWGLALAPADFGPFSGDLLAGNLGDGHINAFDPSSGAFLGALTGPDGAPLTIDTLWGLSFGNGHGAGAANTLYFTAGADSERHGLFGQIRPAGASARVVDATVFTPPSTDDYPLPPAAGPALPVGGAVLPAAGPVLLPVAPSSLALAPTLSAAPAAGSDAAAAPQGSFLAKAPADLLLATIVLNGPGPALALAPPSASEFGPGMLSGGGAAGPAGGLRDAPMGLGATLGLNATTGKDGVANMPEDLSAAFAGEPGSLAGQSGVAPREWAPDLSLLLNLDPSLDRGMEPGPGNITFADPQHLGGDDPAETGTVLAIHGGGATTLENATPEGLPQVPVQGDPGTCGSIAHTAQGVEHPAASGWANLAPSFWLATGLCLVWGCFRGSLASHKAGRQAPASPRAPRAGLRPHPL
jgi:uncharacterized protein (TIGR03118 family)